MNTLATDGRVEYEIRADDSSLSSDLASAQSKVISSENEASTKRESIEKSTSEAIKSEKEKTTSHHEQENDKRTQDDKETGSEREKTEEETSEKIQAIATSTATTVAATMGAAIGAAAIALGVFAVTTATDLDSAMNTYIAKTGTSIDETERYQTVLENIYTNNYGESFEDIADSMATVTQVLGDMDDESLQTITESAFALRDTFEYDVTESVRATKAMMDNFGISGEEAMNLIAAGAQNGLDYSGELMDSISEYSTYFDLVGLDADAMFKIFEAGAESGAWNLDKVGDAVKELSIRVVDGSDTTAEGFELAGLNADEMAAKFAEGGDAAEEAFMQTIEALASIEDPLEQNTAGVDLFGTMWEDLGADVVTSLGDIADGAYDTTDALETIKEVKYDDFGSMLDATTRALEMLLIPLGEALIPILTELIDDVLPVLEELLPVFTELIAGLMPFISELIEALLPVFVELLDMLAEPIMELLEALLPPLIELLNALLPLFSLLIELLEPIIDLFIELLPSIVDIIENGITPLVEALISLIELAIDPLIWIIELLGEIFQEVMNEVFGVVKTTINGVTDIYQGLLDFTTGVFTGDWSKAWSGIVSIFSGFVSILGGLFDDIIAIITTGFSIMKTYVSDNIQTTVSCITGMASSIRTIFNGIIDFITGTFTGDWSKAWSGVTSIFSGIFSGISTMFKAPINAVIDGINAFINGLNTISIPDWAGGYSFNINTISKLRVGMDFVPEDDFPAILHRGEAVLTAEENAMLQNIGGISGLYAYANTPSISDIETSSNPKGGGGPSGDEGGSVINQTININQKVQTPDETARAIRTETRLNNIYD